MSAIKNKNKWEQADDTEQATSENKAGWPVKRKNEGWTVDHSSGTDFSQPRVS